MTAIRIDNFGGTAPRRSERLLPESFAAVAENTNLTSGELRGFNQLKEVQDFSADVANVNTVFRLPAEDSDAEVWVRFAQTNVEFHKGPLVNDSFKRYYWTGESAYPEYNSRTRINAGSSAYKLGVLAPTAAPSLVVTGGSGDTVSRSYVYTFVSSFGEEGPPSDPVLVTGFANGSWDLSALETTMTDISLRDITHKNIYRTVQGENSTSFFFVAQIALATTTYSDTAVDSTIVLNSILESAGFVAPPADLAGLTVMPNGILAGFIGRDLYFCEPYRPHAWPVSYILSVDFPIVGLGVLGSSLIVCTTSAPYVVSGITPASMTLNKLDTIEPCLSARSIVSTQDGVYYASKNGYVLVTPGGANLVTRPLLTSDQWNSLYTPATIFAARYSTRIMGFDSLIRGFIFDYNEPNTALVKLTEATVSLTQLVDIWTDRASGNLYFLINKKVYEFDPLDSVGQTYTWRSKQFDLPRPCNMAAAMVKAETSEVVPAELITARQTYNASLIAAGGLAPVNHMAVNGAYRKIEPDASLSEPPKAEVGGSPILDAAGSSLNGTITVKLWADGVLVVDRQVTANGAFRIPSKRQAHVWQVELTSDLPIYSFVMATTRKELQVA